MILIQELFLDTKGKLVIKARTDKENNNHFTKLVIKRVKGKNLYDEKDLSEQLNIATQIRFEYTAKEIGLGDAFLGLYYVELEDSNKQTVRGFFTEFSVYYDCLLNAIMKIKTVKGCAEIFSDCLDCQNKATLVNLYLDALNIALKSGYVVEAEKSLLVLDELCEICRECNSPKYYAKSTEKINLGIVNNHIEAV